MASQALYRKWRSQTFQELVGQEHVVQTLRNAIAQDRIAHAYLFTGPRGVGKTSVARILAKAVNCLASAAAIPCGVCASCMSIAEGSAVDVIEMDAASHTSVEDAREIIERVQFRPSASRYKVYIIDEVHMLSSAAFNALLKTLEEPPGHALFIMATTESHKIPQTILSRCQKFVFKRHTVRDIAVHLVRIAGEEGLELEPAAAEAIARTATGSLRDALSILDQLIAYGSQQITATQVRDMLGATEAAEVMALIDALIDADLPAGLRAVGAIADQGSDLRQFARDLVERMRALLLLRASNDSSLLDVTEDELVTLEQQAARADTAALLAWVRMFSALDHQLRTSPFGQLPLELAVVEALVGPGQAVAPAAAAPTSRRPAAAPASRNTPAAAQGSSAGIERPPAASGRPAASSRPAVATDRSAVNQPSLAERAGAGGEQASAPAGLAEAAEPQPLMAPNPVPAGSVDQPAATGVEDVGEPPSADQPAPEREPGSAGPSAASVEEPVPAGALPVAQADAGGEALPAADHPAFLELPDAADMLVEPPAAPASASPLPETPVAVAAAAAASRQHFADDNAAFLLSDVETHWKGIINDVKPYDKMIYAVLLDVQPINVEGNTLVLLAKSPFHQRRMEEDRTKRIVERVLSRALGTQCIIRCTLDLQDAMPNHQKQREEVRKDKLVRAAVNIFDADIVSIEPYPDDDPPL